MGYTHQIRPNHSEASPSRHLFFDCEAARTDKAERIQKLRLRLWCASLVNLRRGHVSTRKTAHGTKPDEFFRFLFAQTSLDRPVWVWCHNAMCDWSWIDLWSYLDSGVLSLKTVILQ